jgi:hypothetical protein
MSRRHVGLCELDGVAFADTKLWNGLLMARYKIGSQDWRLELHSRVKWLGWIAHDATRCFGPDHQALKLHWGRDCELVLHIKWQVLRPCLVFSLKRCELNVAWVVPLGQRGYGPVCLHLGGYWLPSQAFMHYVRWRTHVLRP